MNRHTAERQVEHGHAQMVEALHIFASMGDHVRTAILVESVDRRVITANRTFCDLFARGVEPETLAGADSSSATASATHLVLDPERFLRRVEAIVDAGSPVAAEQVAFADGRVFERDYIPTQAPSRLDAHVWQYRDITKRRRTEEALERREAQLRRLVDASPIGILFSDFSGAITEANDAFLRLLGYSRDDVAEGRLNWRELTPPESAAASDRADEEARAHGVYEPFEKEYLHRDGHRVPVLVGGVLFEGASESGYGIDFVLDLTERKRAEAALRESEARYRSIFESDLTGNYISTPDGRMLACNEAFARIYGYESVAEALATPASAVYPNPEERVEFLDLLRRERRLTRFEFATRRRDGTTMHSVDFVEGVFDDAGALVEIHGSCFDDTQRKALEEQLRQSQKLEAIGRLAGGIAHDFNNLLTVIAGYGAFMLEQMAESDPIRETAREVLDAATRATGLTQQLLAFSRRQVLKPRVLNLNVLVEDLERMLRRLIGEDVALATSLDPSLPNVEADPSQLEQVIANLVVNARDAMPDGGRITIATATTTREIAGQGPVRYVELAVSDTGTGMDDETRSHVFEPFFTTKSAGRGTGLGLATVYGIVSQSRGEIDVETATDRGTTMRVRLPAVTAEATPEPSHAEPESPCDGTETVLLVEDEDAVRRLAATALRQFGYNVLEARGGGEALLTSEQYPETIHIVVSDIVMPQMNGRAVVERVRATRPEIKALFMSGYTEDEVLHRGISEDREAFLAKPFSPWGFVRKVRDVLDEPDRGGHR